MPTFTIDNDNNITAHGTPEEAAAATATPFDSFSSQQELAVLVASWPAVAWSPSAKAAASRIWEHIQRLGDAEKPKAGHKAKGSAQAAKGAPAKAKTTKNTTATKKAPNGKKAARAQQTAGPREGSKTAQVAAMLQRKNGATLAEIMDKMGWQKHTVRGFMAGAMKKAGYTVESFKPEGGERTYRINN